MKTRISRVFRVVAAVVSVARRPWRLAPAKQTAGVTYRGPAGVTYRGPAGMTAFCRALVAVALLALSAAVLPQAAWAQVTIDFQVRCVGGNYFTGSIPQNIGGCDRNGGAIGFALREGDRFEVEVRVTAGDSNIPTTPANANRAISAIVVVPAGITTTGSTSGTINARTGPRFTLNAANSWSHTQTWTVTDDNMKEEEGTVAFLLHSNAHSSVALGSATVTVAGGNNGRTRNVIIQESDQHILTPSLASGNSVAEGQASTRFDILLDSGSDSLDAGLNSVCWYVTFPSAQPATAADFTGTSMLTGNRNSCAGQTGATFTTGISTSVTTTPNAGNFFRINIADDFAIEATPETFRLHLGGPTTLPGVTYGFVDLMITDNDGVTFNVAPGINTNNNFGVEEGASDSARNIRIQYVAQAGAGRELGSDMTLTATLVGEGPAGLNVATSGYPAGVASERLSTVTGAGADFASNTFQCTIPSTTVHDGIVNCPLPVVTDDTLSERVEHFSVALSGGPAGVQYGDKRFHFIRASDVINMRITEADYEGTESGGAVSVTVEFSAASGVTIPTGLSEFRLLFDDGDSTYVGETPAGGNTDLISGTPIWHRAEGMRGYTFTTNLQFGAASHMPPSADTMAEADEVQTWRLRGTLASIGWNITGGDSGNDGTFTVTYVDDDPHSWTVRARGHGARVSDVNEDATPLASATDASFDGTSNTDAGTSVQRMFFRFTNGAGANTRAATTVTYCLRGSATGGTSTDTGRDYTYPTDYNPTATTAAHADYTGSCTGRGTFTIAANTSPHYRFPITLVNDDLNEGDETIIFDVVNVVESGYPSALDGIQDATRTIKDNDTVTVAIANQGDDADTSMGADGFQIVEGNDAVFRVTPSGGTRTGDIVVAFTVGGDVEAADYTVRTGAGSGVTFNTGTSAGTLTIAVAESSKDITIATHADADSDASEDITVTLAATGHTGPGAVERTGTMAMQSATQKITNRVFQHTLRLRRFNAAYDTEASGTVYESGNAAARTMHFLIDQADLPTTQFEAARMVTWTVTHGATSDADFTGATTGTITFPTSGCTATVMACRFSLIIADDNLDEPNSEGFSIVLSVDDDTVDGGINVGSGLTGLTVGDSDDFTVDIRTANTNVQEGGFAVVTLTPTKPAAREVRIAYDHPGTTTEAGLTLTTDTGDVDATLPTGGAAGGDFGALRTGAGSTEATTTEGFTVTFPANSRDPQYLLIPITADNLNEPAETFQLTTFATGIVNEYTSGRILPVGSDDPARGLGLTFTIAASDAMTASVAAAAATYNEGQTARFTVTLTGATAGSAAAVMVPYSLGLSAADADAGYTLAELNTANSGLSLSVGSDGATGRLSIPMGQTTGNIDITLPVDADLTSTDDDQMLTLTLTADNPGTTNSDEGPTSATTAGGDVTVSATSGDETDTVTINFIDTAHVFTLTSPATSITETNADANTQYTLAHNGPTIDAMNDLVVSWTVITTGDNTASASDISASSGMVTFSSTDAADKNFNVGITGDTNNEPDETFTLRLSIASSAAVTANGGADLPADLEVTIVDNDPVRVAISRQSGTGPVGEGSGALNFEIALTGGTRASGVSTVVPFTVSGLDNTEFAITTPALAASATGGEVTILHSTSSAIITVMLQDDSVNEAQETVTVTGTAVGASGLRLTGTAGTFGRVEYIGAGAASVMVNDDDPITVSIENQGTDADPAPGGAAGFQVEEGGPAVFRVTLTGGTHGGSVSVPFTVTGIEDADVTGGLTAITSSPLTIAAGQTTADITIPLATDTDTPAGDETSEALTVMLGTPTLTPAAGTIARSGTAHTAVQNIIEQGAMHRFTLTSPAASIDETDAAATQQFTMARTGPTITGAGITVTWAVANGTTADADFTTATQSGGTVVFTGSETSETFTVGIAGDEINEPGETFTLQFSIASGAHTTSATANGGATVPGDHRVTINDDDDIELEFTAASATVAETEASADTPRIVRLNVNLGATASNNVHISVFARSAEAVTARGNANEVAATGGAAPAMDAEPAAGQDTYISAVNPRQTTAAPAGYITFHSGESSGYIDITIVDDNVNESTEVYALSATVSSGGHRNAGIADGARTLASPPQAAAIFAITDDDPITYSIARSGTGVVEEGDDVAFTVTLSGASAVALAIPYAVTSNGDYDVSSITPGMVTIPAGDEMATLTLTTPADRDFAASDLDQTVTVELAATLTSPTGAGAVTRGTSGSAMFTVDSTDAAQTFTLSSPAATIAETDANADTMFTVSRLGVNVMDGKQITLTYTVRLGGATAADFSGGSAPTGTVTFELASASETFPIGIAGDGLNEPDERFTITFSIASAHRSDAEENGRIALPHNHTVTITDDDNIELSATRVAQRRDEGQDIQLDINLGAIPTRDVTVAYTFANTAATGDVDATLPGNAGADITDPGGGSIMITAAGGMATARISLPVTDDTLNEAAETLVVRITAAGITGGYRTATLAMGGESTFTIAASDPITVSIGDAADVNEGAAASFTITLAGATSGSAADISVPYTVASSGVTYDVSSITPGTVTVPAGMTSHTLRLTMPTDTDADSGEPTVTVTLTADNAGTTATDEGPTAATGGGAVTVSTASGANTGAVDVTLVAAAHTFELTSPAATINEDDTDVTTTYTVERTGPAITGGSLSIGWEVTAGTATAADFSGNALPSGTVTFSGSDTSETFTVVVAGDNLNEADETFTITFSNATSDSITTTNRGVAEPADQSVTINDDDDIALTTSVANNGMVSEGGNAVVTVNLGAIPTHDIGVGYSIRTTTATDDVSAILTSDYTNTSGNSITITAAAGVPTGDIMVAIVDDNLNESAETFVVRITTLQVTGAHGTVTTPEQTMLSGSSGGDETVFTIADNDDITYSIAPHADTGASIDEGQSAVFTITLAGATAGSAAAITVPYTVAGLPNGVTPTFSPTTTNAAGNPTLVIAAGSLTGDITITIPNSESLNDDTSDSTMRVNLGTASVATGGGTATRGTPAGASVTVDWQTAAHSFDFTTPVTSITEGAAATTYTVTRTASEAIPDGESITVTWAFAAGTPAPVAADFHNDTLPAGGMLEFTGSETSETFTVRTKEDTLNEADEQFTLTLSIAPANMQAADDAGGANVRTAPLTVTIADDDPISVTFTRRNNPMQAASVTESASFTVQFALGLSGATRTANVEVPFTVSGVDNAEFAITAPSGIAATAAGGTITLDTTDTTVLGAFVTVTVTGNDLNEATRTLTITGGTPSTAGSIDYADDAARSASVDIEDDDAIVVSIARHADTTATLEEGSTARFTVSFANAAGTAIASAGPITVAYTADWDRAAFTDGRLETGRCSETSTSSASGSVTIAAGRMSDQIAVRICHVRALDDTVNMSPNEDFTVELGTITHDAPAGTAAEDSTDNEVTITVDWIDAAHTIEVADAMVEEGAASIIVTREASEDLNLPVDIAWSVTTTGSGATHAADDDFAGGLPSGSVRFSGSQTEATIRVPIVDDNLAEMAETFTLELSDDGIMPEVQNANNLVDGDDTATITITDNDDIRISIGGQRRIGEERTVTFPVTLSARPSAQLTVMWAVAGSGSGTCTDGSETVAAVAGDFAMSADGDPLTTLPTGQTLTFAENVTSQTITLYTSAGAQATSAADEANSNGDWDQSCDREFTITLSMPSGGGGTNAAMAPATPLTVTISEDNPEAIAALNEAVLPEVARAVATNQIAAIAERVGAAGGVAASVPSFNLNGQSTAAGVTAENLRDWANGDTAPDTKELLRDMDFVMPLSAGAAGDGLTGARLALWGGSDYRDFKGEGGGANKPKWDGEMFSLHLGADARVRDGLLAGVMLSHSDAESDYSYNDNGRIVTGEYELEMTGFSPYMSWDLRGGGAWLSLGYGQGDLTIDPDQEGDDTMESDVDMTSFAAGGTRALRASDAHELNLKADAFMATIDVDGDDTNENLGAIDVDANRLRVLVESRHKFALASGATFTPLVDMGARHDGGDGNTGTGVEVGGGLHYHDAATGLTVESRARVLLGRSNQNEWGVGLVARLAPGADGQGLSLSLAPNYGDADADTQGMWEAGVADTAARAKSAANPDREATLAAEVGYGLTLSRLGWRNGGSVFSRGGLLTPYSALQFGDKNDYRMGLRWATKTGLSLDLSTRHTSADNNNALTLEGKVKF